MMVVNDKDQQIMLDYLKAYKECFEAMNDLLNEVIPRVELTAKEIELALLSDKKYKNMVYHIRKWTPLFNKLNKK